MDRKQVARDMKLAKEEYDIREIEDMMPMSEGWLRSMEDKGLIKFKSPRVRGQVKRLFQRSDVVNALRLAAMRWSGVHPDIITEYIQEVRKFRKIAGPFYTKPFDTPIDDAVFLFCPDDIFPDGDPNNFTWPKDEKITASLTRIYALLWQARTCLRQAENLYRMVEHFDQDVQTFLSVLTDKDEMLPHRADAIKIKR